MMIGSASALDRHFDQLTCGDVIVGLLPAKYLRPALVADLMERGVRCVPSPLCQLISRSKCAQALLLQRWMAPHTQVITRRAELMAAVSYCAQHGISGVITKQEGMHCGHGIRRWDNAETLYNTVAFTDSTYPFVLQPYLPDITDIRVIVAGDYVEAYIRENEFNFRANLAVGGVGRSLEMDAAIERLCREIMTRGRFPYAHIDFHLTSEGCCWLSEIALDGGIAAAQIDRNELRRRKQEILERLAQAAGDRSERLSKEGGIP